jgi:hypothetical protein
VYNTMRDHGQPDAATLLRVRRLAGVVDGDGVPRPGYALTCIGCIIDAAEARQ